MVLNSDQYLEIRNILFHIGCSSTRLDKLKTNFREDINSQRAFERVNSLPCLFKILEKRDTLGPEQVVKLIQIITEIAPGNIEVKNILFSRDASSNNINYSGSNHNTPYNNRLCDESVLPPVPLDVVERINEMVKSSIGLKWKELARALKIPEGKIDALEYQYKFTDVPRMVHEILRYHREKCGTNFHLWRSELQQGLDKARRRDLSENIDDILKFNSPL